MLYDNHCRNVYFNCRSIFKFSLCFIGVGSEAFMACKVNKIFTPYQLCQLFKNERLFRDHLCSNFVTLLVFETIFSSILIKHISVNGIYFYCRLRDGKVHCLRPHFATPCYHNYLVRFSVWDKWKRTHILQNVLHEYVFFRLCCNSI
jgi:hypothetical protein